MLLLLKLQQTKCVDRKGLHQYKYKVGDRTLISKAETMTVTEECYAAIEQDDKVRKNRKDKRKERE